MTLKQSPKSTCRRTSGPASIRIRLSRAHRDLYPKEDSIEYCKLRKEHENVEYKKLRKLLPSVTQSSDKLTIINEAARYINQLHEQLMDKINRGLLPVSVLETLREQMSAQHQVQMASMPLSPPIATARVNCNQASLPPSQLTVVSQLPTIESTTAAAVTKDNKRKSKSC